MKKILLIALLFFAAVSVEAQVTLRPGIRAGANLSSITGTDLDSKLDFYIGGFAALKLSKFYTLQPEVTYSRQGGKGDISLYDSNTGTYSQRNVDLSLQYISLSAISKFTLTDSFNVHIGPTFDIITNSNNYAYDDIDLGITAGVGYTLPMGLTIEARVKKGIVEAVDTYYYSNNDDNYYGGGNGTNLVFSLGVSYSFQVTGSSK